jgi:hypothetical protein
MTQEQLDLLQLSASSPTQLRAGTPQIVECDARHPDYVCILLQ